VAPALVLVGGVYAYPAITTFAFSVGDLDLASFRVVRSVGLAHYLAALADQAFHATTVRTIYFACAVVLLTVVAAFPIAVLLNQRFWGRGLVRVVVLLPWAVPPVVSGVLWGQMFHAQSGFINGLIRALGGTGDIIWLGDATLALHAIIVAEVWRAIPFATLFLLAGLQTLPVSAFEAAQIDGASPWARFRYLTLPLMWPIILPVMIVQFVWAMKAFDIIFVLTRGGPRLGTTTLNYLVYQEAFQNLRFGAAAATAYILSLVTLLVIAALGYLRWRASLRYQLAGP
jgi:multiple sugar transport system permease protein